MLAVQPSAVVLMVGAVLPVDWVKVTPPAPIVDEYLTESAKYASSAVTRLRRSDFIEARYAFSFVLANFGIAIAAKMPMITTTMSNSISVKPLRRFSIIWGVEESRRRCMAGVGPTPSRAMGMPHFARHSSCLHCNSLRFVGTAVSAARAV